MFYELGLVYGLEKPVILMSDKNELAKWDPESKKNIKLTFGKNWDAEKWPNEKNKTCMNYSGVSVLEEKLSDFQDLLLLYFYYHLL